MSGFQSTRLDNGIEIVGEQMPGVQSVAVAILIGHGAVDDPDEKSGLAHLVESAMLRGTESRTSRDISEQMDQIGARYSSSTGLEMTLFSSSLLRNHFSQALPILLDVVRSASFPDEELEAVRELQLQEIGQRGDQPAQMVMDLGRQRYFAGHSLGKDSLGSPVTVRSITRAEVVDNWRHWFQPGALLIAIAGNFDWAAAVEQIRRLSEDWSGSGERWSSTAPTLYPSYSVVQSPGAQENLCFMFPGVSIASPDYYSAALASTVLGSGMNSRLFTEVREKRGLAYSVGARTDAMSSTGLVRIYVGTQPERAAESVECIHAELERLAADGVTTEELNVAKSRLKSRVVMGSESTGNRVMSIGRDWFFERRYRTLAEIRESIDAVTTGAILEHLQRIDVMGNLGLVALGPLDSEQLGIHYRVQPELAAAGQEL